MILIENTLHNKHAWLKRLMRMGVFAFLVVGLGFFALSAMEETKEETPGGGMPVPSLHSPSPVSFVDPDDEDEQLRRAIALSLESQPQTGPVSPHHVKASASSTVPHGSGLTLPVAPVSVPRHPTFARVPVIGREVDTIERRHMHLLNVIRGMHLNLDIRSYVATLGMPTHPNVDVFFVNEGTYSGGIHDRIGSERYEQMKRDFGHLLGLLEQAMKEGRYTPDAVAFILSRFTRASLAELFHKSGIESGVDFSAVHMPSAEEFFPMIPRARIDALETAIEKAAEESDLRQITAEPSNGDLIAHDLLLSRALLYRGFVIARAHHMSMVLSRHLFPQLQQPEALEVPVRTAVLRLEFIPGYFERGREDSIESFMYHVREGGTRALWSDTLVEPHPHADLIKTPMFIEYAHTWEPSENYEYNRQILRDTILALVPEDRQTMRQLCEFYTVFAKHCCSSIFESNLLAFIDFERTLFAPQVVPQLSPSPRLVRPVPVRPAKPVDLVELKKRAVALVDKIKVYAEKANDRAKKAERIELNAELEALKLDAEGTPAVDALNTLSIPSVNKTDPFVLKRKLAEYLA